MHAAGRRARPGVGLGRGRTSQVDGWRGTSSAYHTSRPGTQGHLARGTAVCSTTSAISIWREPRRRRGGVRDAAREGARIRRPKLFPTAQRAGPAARQHRPTVLHARLKLHRPSGSASVWDELRAPPATFPPSCLHAALARHTLQLRARRPRAHLVPLLRGCCGGGVHYLLQVDALGAGHAARGCDDHARPAAVR